MVHLKRGMVALGSVLALASTAQGQTFRSQDTVIRAMWREGMERSRLESLAEALLDSIGPRLSGTPQFTAATDWLMAMYQSWGVDARKEQYGTWRGWKQGVVHVDLLAPRVQTLEAKLLSWSPGTGPKPVEADVIAIPEFASAAEAASWLPGVKGKIVLASPPEPMCREPQAFEKLARPETFARWQRDRQSIRDSWRRRLQALGRDPHRQLEDAGAMAVLTSNWSMGWGVNKVFDAQTQRAVSLDLSCEDYGILYRLATHRQGPRVRIFAEAQPLPTTPMYNVIAELKGGELPDEYVMLSAHLDSWGAAEGATDNGTGTLTMLEAMRILKATYPRPRRTILVGHWGAEEEGAIGSRSFTEDHPDVVQNLQVLFNQDNGTWRVEVIETQGLARAGANVARWIAQLPSEMTDGIDLQFPGPQENPGSDHVSFLCSGAPGLRLQSNYPDYRQYTWHTNRDTYDKIVFDDLKNNATLAAMLMYQASEDPERVSRERAILPTDPQTGLPRQWMPCRPARRSYQP